MPAHSRQHWSSGSATVSGFIVPFFFVLTVLTVLTLLAVPASAAAAPDTAPDNTTSRPPPVPTAASGISLLDDTVGIAEAARIRIRPWPRKRIRVAITLRGMKLRAATRGLRDWNKAKVGVRFKAVTARKKADVVVREVKRPACGGVACADVGYYPRHVSQVTIMKGLRPGDASDPLMARLYATIVAHELGHVLGLEHSNKPNSLMYPYIPHPTTVTSTEKCRFYVRHDLKRARRLYRGRGSMTPRTNCRFWPAAQPITSASTSASYDKVDLRWQPARNAGAHVVVRGPANGACPAAPTSGTVLATAARDFVRDYNGDRGSRFCYRIFPVNIEGFINVAGSRAAHATVTPRIPAPPVPFGIAVTHLPDPNWQNTLAWQDFEINGFDGDLRLGVAETCSEQTALTASITSGSSRWVQIEMEPDVPLCLRIVAVARDPDGTVLLSDSVFWEILVESIPPEPEPEPGPDPEEPEPDPTQP